MSKIFGDKFNALSVKQQYFTLKYVLQNAGEAGEILATDEFDTWIHLNREEVVKNATTWNVQFNAFKP